MLELLNRFSRKSRGLGEIGLLVVFLAVSLSLAQTSSSLGWLAPDGKLLPFVSNEEVEDFLRTAEIVSQKRIGAGINNPLEGLVGERWNSDARRLSRCSCGKAGNEIG